MNMSDIQELEIATIFFSGCVIRINTLFFNNSYYSSGYDDYLKLFPDTWKASWTLKGGDGTESTKFDFYNPGYKRMSISANSNNCSFSVNGTSYGTSKQNINISEISHMVIRIGKVTTSDITYTVTFTR